MDRLSQKVFNQKHPRKPIQYWTAVAKFGEAVVIDANNSIAILRARYVASVHYKAIR